MKVKARTNDNIVDLPDDQARLLIAAGVYDAVDDAPDDSAKVKPRRKGR